MNKIFIFFLLILILQTVSLSSAVLVVKQAGGGTHVDLQQAVNSAGSGDEIYIADNNSYTNITLYHKKNIIITVSNGYVPVISGGGNAAGIVIDGSTNMTIAGLSIDSKQDGIFMKNSSVSNFIFHNTIRNSSRYGIYFSGSVGTSMKNNVIKSNIITNTGTYGLYLSGNDTISNQIIRNVIQTYGISSGISIDGPDYIAITSNIIFSNYNGILIQGNSDFIKIFYNTITNNSLNNIYINSALANDNVIKYNYIKKPGSGGAGIYLSQTDNNDIISNTIMNCKLGIFIYSQADNCTIRDNILKYNEKAIDNYSGTGNTINYNTILFTGTSNSYYGIRLRSGNNIEACFNYINFAERGIYVTTGDGYFITNNTIMNCSRGIHLSSSADSHVIKNNLLQTNVIGIYNYSGAGNKIFFNTILNSLAEGGTNEGYGIKFGKNGINNIIVSNYIDTAVRGIYFYDGDNDIVSNNIIYNCNRAIHLSSHADNHIIKNNLLQNNGRGIYIYRGDNNKVYNNTILNMTEYGITIYSNNINNRIYANSIDNGARGIYLYKTYHNTISNNIILNCSRGIHLSKNANTNIIKNNLVKQNERGILIWEGHNNIIYFNDIKDNNEGVYLNVATNNIVRNNVLTGNQIGLFISSDAISSYTNYANNIIYNSSSWAIYSTKPAVIGYSCVNGALFPGVELTNSIQGDPEFKSIVEGNSDYLRLQDNSPCIDAGYAWGNINFSFFTLDIGIYEYTNAGMVSSVLLTFPKIYNNIWAKNENELFKIILSLLDNPDALTNSILVKIITTKNSSSITDTVYSNNNFLNNYSGRIEEMQQGLKDGIDIIITNTNSYSEGTMINITVSFSNINGVFSQASFLFSIRYDLVPPFTDNSLGSGTYFGNQDVILTPYMNKSRKKVDKNAKTYYSLFQTGKSPGKFYSYFSPILLQPQKGKINICYYSVDSAGNTENMRTNTYIIYGKSTGKISLYPTIANINLIDSIKIVIPERGVYNITLYNIKGRMVWKDDVTISSAGDIFKWSYFELIEESGIYFFHCKGNRIDERKKVIIIK